jgi:hypothetical protein
MSKKRRRSQKEKVRYPFLMSRQTSSINGLTRTSVKRESKNFSQEGNTKTRLTEKANIQAISEETRLIKNDIKKNLMITCLVVVIELVIYLAWKKFFLS